MPTKDRLDARAAADEELDLTAAAARAHYTPESLRKLQYKADPPPLRRRRGRLYARTAELDAWIARRDGIAS